MARRPRIEFAGATYHVIQRGNNKEFIFTGPEHKEFLLELLQRAVSMDKLDIFAYVIMDNHLHLAVQTKTKPLSTAMHRLNTRFSVYYNRKLDRTGHVFEGRYKAVPIKDERYLLAVVRYIHRNPIRAGICARVDDYKWSSDADYRGERKGFVHTKQLLDILDEDPKRAFKKYNLLMEKDDEGDWEDVSFVVDIRPGQIAHPVPSAPAVPPAPPVPPAPAAIHTLQLDEILMATGVSREEFTLIKSGSRKRALVPYKARYIREALAQGYTLQNIGENIGISAVAVNKLRARPLTY